MLLSAADAGVKFDWNSRLHFRSRRNSRLINLNADFSGRVAISMLYRMAFGLDPEAISPDHKCLNDPDVLVAAMHECNTTSSG